MQQSSQAATVFLAHHLRQLHELRQRYLTTPWRSLEEAEAGFQLLLQAEAVLQAQAAQTAANFAHQVRKGVTS